MERLTHERVNGIKSGYWSAATKETLVQRLAAYEETGLTPDEVKAIHKFFNYRTMAEFEKLHDLLAAEAEGRLVVLPCKVGDKVWMIVTKRPKLTAPEISFIKSSRLTWNNMRRVLRDFGKTVFLTREEAEAALEGESTDA